MQCYSPVNYVHTNTNICEFRGASGHQKINFRKCMHFTKYGSHCGKRETIRKHWIILKRLSNTNVGCSGYSRAINYNRMLKTNPHHSSSRVTYTYTSNQNSRMLHQHNEIAWCNKTFLKRIASTINKVTRIQIVPVTDETVAAIRAVS